MRRSRPMPSGVWHLRGTGCKKNYGSTARPPSSEKSLLSLDFLMATPRALILRAPGANCDAEAQFAFQLAGAHAEGLHINRLREQPALLQQFQILVVPGGFTYGDDVAAG